MKWKNVLDNWYNGKNLPSYRKKIKNPYLWKTSHIDKDESSLFEEEFIEDIFLDKDQDFNDFKTYINKSKNNNVVSFLNLSGDTILVVPIPKKNKNFSNLKNFIDEASNSQQKQFWKKVVIETRKLLKNNDKVWISTHGFAVPYLHVRISKSPKYYGNSKLK